MMVVVVVVVRRDAMVPSGAYLAAVDSPLKPLGPVLKAVKFLCPILNIYLGHHHNAGSLVLLSEVP
ncbi:hypothetical protein E2C01_054353 [Portunus trituberculatus]|uniref:Uncharacterized protein n=1 Tax=Portunus trituberculatus TaxID=210409 RepID=A0A5B7GN91_PORTR|nr:hypothetical protein [Portunus trituberculatus]